MADEQNSEDVQDTFDDLSAVEKDAAALSDAAIRLDQARGDDGMLVAALDHNLERSGSEFARSLIGSRGKMVSGAVVIRYAPCPIVRQ